MGYKNSYEKLTLSKRAIKSSFWIGLFKTLDWILSFLRKVILAKLLAPADFGLFGLACLTMSMLETFTQTGIGSALIQKKDNIDEFLNTAWTINALRGLALSACLFFSAPLIAIFFKNNSVIPFVKAIALIVLINGIKNIKVIYFIKNLDFKKQFLFQTIRIITDFCIVVIFALILRNAWALLFGMLAGSFAECISSYFIYPYMPHLKLNKQKIKELVSYSKWVSSATVIIFLLTQGDDILVGRMLGLVALGFYQMAYAISNLPATQITHIISQVAFPLYSKLQNDLNGLREAYLRIFQVISFLVFPITLLTLALAEDLVRILLSDKWIPIVAPMQILLIGGLVRSLGASIGPLLQGIGKPKILAKFMFYQLIIMVVTIYPFIKFGAIIGASLAVVIPGFIINMILFIKIKQLLGLQYSIIRSSIFWPFCNSILATLPVYFIKVHKSTITLVDLAGLCLLFSLGYILITIMTNRNYWVGNYNFLKKCIFSLKGGTSCEYV